MSSQGQALDRRVVITALGFAQILAWGTSFYFPAVFAGPIVADTGWSLGWVVGGTSVGLLVAGLISPQVGRIIDLHGGRPVLLASSLFYAAGLIGIGLAPALPVYLMAWVLLGIGMGTGLYDAVFAALGRMYGSAARGPITNLTLFGGFASTVCWPLSAFMIEHAGWRNACFVYAALHLLVALPLQMAVIRRAPVSAAVGAIRRCATCRARAHRQRNAHLRAAGAGAVARRRHRLDRGRAFADLPAGEGRRLRGGSEPRHAVRPGAGRRPRGGAAVRGPLSPDLDHDRFLHADGGRPAPAGRPLSDPGAGDPALWRRLRHFLDRPRHAAAGAVRAAAVSPPDGQAGVPEPDRAGAGAVGRRAGDRSEWSRCDHRCIDGAGADQCGADRRVVGGVPAAAAGA